VVPDHRGRGLRPDHRGTRDRLQFVTLAQQDLPGTRVALERTFAAAQAKRVRRTRRQQPGDQ
jgi:hypothetical protein